MRIADVLRNKGAAVVTIHPDATVMELLAGLAEHNIGAMVVIGREGLEEWPPSVTWYASYMSTAPVCWLGRCRPS